MERRRILILHRKVAERGRLAAIAEAACAPCGVSAGPSWKEPPSWGPDEIPDLILASVEGKGAGGIRILEQVRAASPEFRVPVLFLAAPAALGDAADRLLEAGADDVVPADAAEAYLAAKLRAVLAHSSGDAELRAANKVLADLVSQRSIALRDSEDRFRLIFSGVSDPVVAFEVRSPQLIPGRIADANDPACRALGYAKEELLGRRIIDVLDTERLDVASVRMESLLKHHQVSFDTILTSKAGQSIPAKVVARLFTTDEQAMCLAVARPQVADRRADDDARYEIVADRTGQIVYDYTIPTNSIRWTGAVSRVTGYSREEIEGVDYHYLLQMIHPEDRDRVRTAVEEAVRTLGAYHSEYRFMHKSGTYRYLDDEGLALPGEDGRAYRVLGTVRDITARAVAERQRRQFDLEVQHSQRLESLGVLAGGIAHDFNNILAAIVGLTDMALQDIDQDSDTHADLAEVLQAAHRAKDLVKQILAFSRQSGEDRVPLYLHVVIREAMKLARATLPATIEIIDNVDVHSGIVDANAAQMHQVFMNFCTNSAHAMREKGGRIIVSLNDIEMDERMAATSPRLRPGPYVHLSVSDSGHGMNPDILKRVFDPFFTTKGPGEGTGMGLSVVHGIVTSHGGVVKAESFPGIGTTMHVYLPRIVSPVTEEYAATPSLPRAQGRILFVDDEEAVRHFGKAALDRLGYQVTLAGCAAEAIDIYQADRDAFDLLITDQVMPKMSGDELVLALRAMGSEIPVILFTGFGEDLTEEKAARAGIQEIVTKPVVAYELDQVIRRLLEKEKRPGMRRLDAGKPG